MSAVAPPEPTPLRSGSVRKRRSDVPEPKRLASIANRKETSKVTAPFVTLLIAFILSGLTLLALALLLGLFDTKEWSGYSNLHAADSLAQHEALELANATGKPFLIAFHSTSCLACRRMRKPFYVASQRLVDVVPCFSAKVSPAVNKPLLKLFAVDSIPAIYFVKASYRVRYRGGFDPDKIVAFVKDMIRDGKSPHSEKQKKP